VGYGKDDPILFRCVSVEVGGTSHKTQQSTTAIYDTTTMAAPDNNTAVIKALDGHNS
jgi:hypothetical protein